MYNARYDNSRDLQGYRNLGLSHSIDGEWGGKYNGVSDACIVDDNNGIHTLQDSGYMVYYVKYE
ncbi:MAG: hypothetical protein ACRC0A_06765 [Chitinophagaceae bacterium]